MKHSVLIIAFSFLLAVPFTGTYSTAEAQDLRIGYVDPNTIMEKMPEMAAVNRQIRNFIERRQREYAEKEQAFQQRFEEYQQRLSVISDQAREREEQELQRMSMELQEFQQNFQQEIAQRERELVGPLIEKIQNAINAVATEMNLSYVLNTLTSNGDFIILYASEEMRRDYNITDKVSERLEL